MSDTHERVSCIVLESSAPVMASNRSSCFLRRAVNDRFDLRVNGLVGIALIVYLEPRESQYEDAGPEGRA